MPKYFLGESVQLGIGKETTANTKVAPFDWIPTTSSPNIQESLEKATLNNSIGTRSASRGERVIRRMYNGTIASYISTRSLPLYLLSLMGTLTTSGGGVNKTHAATIDKDNIVAPTLSIALAREGADGKDYTYTGSVVNSLTFESSLDGLPTMSAEVMAVTEIEEGSKLTPAYTETLNTPFSQDNIEVKFATNEAGLASATAKEVNSVSAIINNSATGRPTLANKNYKAILAGLMNATMSVEVDSNDDAYKGLFSNNTTQAISVKWTDNDSADIVSGVKPSVEIILPTAVLTNRTENRSMGDVTTETLEITGHQMGSAELVKVNVINNVASY